MSMDDIQDLRMLARPELAILRYINPAAFGPQHLKQLYRLEKFAWDGLVATILAFRIANQELYLWEVGDDDEHAIVLTSIVEADAGDRWLWIEGAAGNGILARKEGIVADLRLIAAFYACSKVRATSARDGFESLPDKLGFEPVSTIWELETDHGGRQQATGTADGNAED